MPMRRVLKIAGVSFEQAPDSNYVIVFKIGITFDEVEAPVGIGFTWESMSCKSHNADPARIFG
jgi:hypothetical protein